MPPRKAQSGKTVAESNLSLRRDRGQRVAFLHAVHPFIVAKIVVHEMHDAAVFMLIDLSRPVFK
jgi:hypothetical protein